LIKDICIWTPLTTNWYYFQSANVRFWEAITNIFLLIFRIR